MDEIDGENVVKEERRQVRDGTKRERERKIREGEDRERQREREREREREKELWRDKRRGQKLKSYEITKLSCTK